MTNTKEYAQEVKKINLKSFIEGEYLPYARYVITSRALIKDDGLKPVNRRVLWHMYESNLLPTKAHLKVQNIGATVSARYHPHGDSSITEAIARMAQGFNMRVPLLDPQGSVGFVSGDIAAAPRYWEARLTKAAVELLSDLDDNAVEMGMNFDWTRKEPTVLPVKWPTGLINGTEGIAVGYASSIFPHNPTEIMNLCIKTLQNPDITTKEILKIVKGPDFPTGGELLATEGVADYVETGKGTIILRGKCEIETLPRGRHAIVFSELPYQVPVEKVIEEITKAKKNKNLFSEISEMKDLSDKKLCFRIITKAGTNPHLVLEDLYKYTSIQIKKTANNTVLIDGKPVQVGLKELINQFLSLRFECTDRKLKHQLNKNLTLSNKLKGFVKILGNVDKAIKIIRKADTQEEAKEQLMTSFKVNEEQAENVLQMRLRTLTKGDIDKVKEELASIEEKIKYLQSILSNEDKIIEYITNELEATKSIIGDKRRTTISNLSSEDLKEASKNIKKEIKSLDKNQDCYITLFADNTFTKTLKPVEKNQFPIVYTLKTKTKSDIIVITSGGDGVKIPVDYIPFDKISTKDFLDIPLLGKIRGFAKNTLSDGDVGILLVTSKGSLNIVSDGYLNNTAVNVVCSLSDGEEVVSAKWITQKEVLDDVVVLVNEANIGVRFKVSEVRVTKSGAGTVVGMKTDTKVVHANVCENSDDTLLLIQTNETLKLVKLNEIRLVKRGSKGVSLGKLSKNDKTINAYSGKNIRIVKLMGIEEKLPPIQSLAKKGQKHSNEYLYLGE